MPSIYYFSRNSKIGFSIEKVFNTIIKEVEKKHSVKNIKMVTKFSKPYDLINNIIYSFKNRNSSGINHITGHIHEVSIGLIGNKTILTIHDLVFLDNVSNPFIKFYKWLFWFYIPLKLVDCVVCISSETQKRILKRINTNKTVVIYNPIDPNFSFVKKEFNISYPTILHIGTGWNKNLLRTIEALSGIPCHLRIIGKINEIIYKKLTDFNIDFSQVYNLSDEEILNEYICCDIVNFPSEYEGFGMPIIEGQKTGRVVITSKIEPLIEISGNAVEFVDPYDVNSIKYGYLNVIHNKLHRENLIKNGLINVERFSVKNISDQYTDLYDCVLNNRKFTK